MGIFSRADKLIQDKENALKGAEGWEVKKLQKEVDALTKEASETKAETKKNELARIGKEYGIDLKKAEEEGLDDPVLLEKALKLAGKTPVSVTRLDSGRSSSGKKDTSEMTADEKLNKGFAPKE